MEKAASETTRCSSCSPLLPPPLSSVSQLDSSDLYNTHAEDASASYAVGQDVVFLHKVSLVTGRNLEHQRPISNCSFRAVSVEHVSKKDQINSDKALFQLFTIPPTSWLHSAHVGMAADYSKKKSMGLIAQIGTTEQRWFFPRPKTLDLYLLQLFLPSYSRNTMSSTSSATFPTLYSLFPSLLFSQCWHGSHHPRNERVAVINAKHVVALALLPCTQPCDCTGAGVGNLARPCATHTSNSPFYSATEHD